MGKWLDQIRAEAPAEPARDEPGSATVHPISPATPEPVSKAAIRQAMERACIDDDEAQWCATGRIPLKTARAYARLFAEQLTYDPDHPASNGMVTCWACPHFRGKSCSKRHRARADAWLWCDDFGGGDA